MGKKRQKKKTGISWVDRIWEGRHAVAVLYAAWILFLLPLYMKNGFVMIGDAKYYFFLYGACFFAVCSAVLLWMGIIFQKVSWKPEFSYTELFALFFGVVTLVSCLLSPYPETAVWGYTDWHMGGVTQAAFLFGLFLAGKWLKERKVALLLAGFAAFLVSALVISNRCGDDPLGAYAGMDWFEWNRRNLLATIGNINWVCCFLSVSVPILLYFAWSAKGKWRILGMAGAFTGIAAICLQGSEAGFLDLGFFLFVLLWMSLGGREELNGFLDILFLVFFFWSLFSVFEVDLITPNNMDIKALFYSGFWLIPMGLVICLKLLMHFLFQKKDFLTDGKVRRLGHILMAAAFGACAVAFLLCQVSDDVWGFFGSRPILRITPEWGSYRGMLWETALQCYGKLGITGKLFGVGPDCFCHVLEELRISLSSEGQWLDAVYANAHNEALTMLLNEGIMGLISYGGIFVSFLVGMGRRTRKTPIAVLGILVVGGYLVNNMVAFQQVISTPFVFFMMGMLGMETESKAFGKETGKKRS